MTYLFFFASAAAVAAYIFLRRGHSASARSISHCAASCSRFSPRRSAHMRIRNRCDLRIFAVKRTSGSPLSSASVTGSFRCLAITRDSKSTALMATRIAARNTVDNENYSITVNTGNCKNLTI